MTRSRHSAATKTAAAAAALLTWLETDRAASAARSVDGLRAGSKLADIDPCEDAAWRAVDPAADAADARASAPSIMSGGGGPVRGSPALVEPVHAFPAMRLANTDWLHHRLTVIGPEQQVGEFRHAAAGAGTIPWVLDLDRMEEDWLHLLISPPAPQTRSLSVAGARIMAGQLRDAVARRHELAMARIGRSRACPLDLNALVPVPDDLLQRGPDDSISLTWLWRHWGTTQALRHVREDAVASRAGRNASTSEAVAFTATFWSADWTPWRALASCTARWPTLRFDVRPTYDSA